MGRARGAASSARGRASGAASAGRARVGGMSRQAKIGAGIGAAGVAAGAGGAAALASRRKREESADNGLDEMREQFNYLTEAVKALQQQMAQPDQEEEIQESARVNATGSSNARSLIEQAALEFTDDPSKAAHFGKMVGKIIEADRGDRQGHWSMRDWSSWQDGEGMPDGNTTVTDSFQERDEKPARTPQRVPVGATGVFASGGGNSTLTEQAGSSSWSDDIDRLLSEVYN